MMSIDAMDVGQRGDPLYTRDYPMAGLKEFLAIRIIALAARPNEMPKRRSRKQNTRPRWTPKEQKKQAAKEAQKAYDATPEGKKERNIAALSAVAGVLLFFLFAGFFHLPTVAFVIGFIAGAPFFWFRARKAGFIVLVIILLILGAKINKSDNEDNDNSNASKASELVIPANSQTTSE